MFFFYKKKILEKKFVRESTISKNLLSGVRDLKKVKNRCSLVDASTILQPAYLPISAKDQIES